MMVHYAAAASCVGLSGALISGSTCEQAAGMHECMSSCMSCGWERPSHAMRHVRVAGVLPSRRAYRYGWQGPMHVPGSKQCLRPHGPCTCREPHLPRRLPLGARPAMEVVAKTRNEAAHARRRAGSHSGLQFGTQTQRRWKCNVMMMLQASPDTFYAVNEGADYSALLGIVHSPWPKLKMQECKSSSRRAKGKGAMCLGAR